MTASMIDNSFLEKGLWQSAEEAFSTMINLTFHRFDHAESAVVVGSITFTGPIKGALFVECPAGTGEKIARSMLMIEDTESLEAAAVKDAIGEVANLVAGGFKTRIMETIGEIDISVPTVISGKAILPSPGLNGCLLRLAAQAGDFPIHLSAVIQSGS